MRYSRLLTAFAVFGLLAGGFAPSTVSAATGEHTVKVGHTIAPFALKDLQGVSHSLGELQGSPVVVVVFMGVECPLAKLYAPRLSELAAEYAPRGVAFLAIDSNAQDSLAEMSHFARAYQLTIPFLKDPGNSVADQFAAERTPEVFVLNRQRSVCYRGRIDDQYGFQSGVGYQRPRAEKRETAQAIDELLADKPVSQATTRAPGCLIGRAGKANEHSEVTFSKQISRLFQDRCVGCHRPGEIAPFSLTNYEEVAGWAPMIDEVVRENRMPPWHADPKVGHFANNSRLSDDERRLIATWVENGAPEGDSKDLPAPRKYASGWQISKPDLVINMSEKPFLVPAEGKVEYQYFTVDPGFKQDMWVQEAEARPGNNAVVHHIIVFVQPPGETSQRMGEGAGLRNLLVGTAPGNPPERFGKGMAKRIPAGSKLLFQMHYTANGAEQGDCSSVGLVFADPATVTREVRTSLAINQDFQVPPGAEDYEVRAGHRFLKDTLILSFMPHMHLRGKAFRYELHYPDGTIEALLDIPRYDFNWQNSYELAEPKVAPKGSVLRCIARFDNSENNLANPDPTHPVGWGEQTWEEMMIGFFVCTSVAETPNLPRVMTAEGAPRDRRPSKASPSETSSTTPAGGAVAAGQ